MEHKLPVEGKLLDSLLCKGRHIAEEQEVLSSGALVRLLRRGLGMTQEQLARRAAVPQSTLSRIENGAFNPSEEMLRKILAAMECGLALVPIPRFLTVEACLRKRAEKIAEKHVRYLEGTMALEHQQPKAEWRKRLLEKEIELMLQSPTQLWEEDAD